MPRHGNSGSRIADRRQSTTAHAQSILRPNAVKGYTLWIARSFKRNSIAYAQTTLKRERFPVATAPRIASCVVAVSSARAAPVAINARIASTVIVQPTQAIRWAARPFTIVPTPFIATIVAIVPTSHYAMAAPIVPTASVALACRVKNFIFSTSPTPEKSTFGSPKNSAPKWESKRPPKRQ